MDKRNVIVVMLDSLGANYVGAYGNKWIKTPNIDRLAKEGVLFENQYIEGLPTVPCRRSMHAGRYFLHNKGWSPLELEDTTIADLCWGRPIDTALIFDCPNYRLAKYGYTRGFDKVWYAHGHSCDSGYYSQDPLYHLNVDDYYEDHVLQDAPKFVGKFLLDNNREETASYLKQRQYWKTDEDQKVAHVMKAAVKYLENIDRNKSFFLFVDSFDPHEPWDPPSVYDPDLKCPYDPDYKGKDMFNPLGGLVEGLYTEPELNHIRMLHAEKVTMCDKWLGHLLDNVRKLGLEDNTLIMLVSDHGEPLGNGKDGHGLLCKIRPWPYEELVHAPLIMKGPGLPAGKRVSAFTQSCDVAPTVTEWLGIGVHPSHTGKSLLPLAKGEVDKVRDFAIAGYYRFSAAIYTEDWSYIHWTKPDDQRQSSDIAVDSYLIDAWWLENTVDGKSKRGQELEKRRNEIKADADSLWVSTPTKSAGVPPKDLLFDRKGDRDQLHDVAGKNPKKAAEMFQTLSEFMVGLRKT